MPSRNLRSLLAACVLSACATHTTPDEADERRDQPIAGAAPIAGGPAPESMTPQVPAVPTQRPDLSVGPSAQQPPPKVPITVTPVCTGGQLGPLVPGMTLIRAVDYLADVANGGVISDIGAVCEHALDRARCADTVTAARAGSRRLVTTEGDEVRVWTPERPQALLGEIDVVEEALWLFIANGNAFSCGGEVVIVADAEGFVFNTSRFEPSGPCMGSTKRPVRIRVGRDGTIADESTSTPMPPSGAAGAGPPSDFAAAGRPASEPAPCPSSSGG